MMPPDQEQGKCRFCQRAVPSHNGACIPCFCKRLMPCGNCRMVRQQGKKVRIRQYDGRVITHCGACGNTNWILKEK